MEMGTEKDSKEADSAAIDSDKSLNCAIEVNAIQVSSVDFSSRSNCQIDKLLNQADQVSTSIKDNKNFILNAQAHPEEECEISIIKNTPFETVEIKKEWEKVDSDENVHFQPVISNEEECSEHPLEISKKLEKSEQHLDGIKSLGNEIVKEMIGKEVHPECWQENKCQTPPDISRDEHKGCALDNIPRSLCIMKHIIYKSSTGKTNKIVRTNFDVQSKGPSPRIIKTPYRKKSPLNWFPRRKTETYLERKIRMLQEAAGLKASLDETLVGSTIILPRVEREKRAVQAAAKEAVETRKAALVEASWCRILEAARIPCRLAGEELEKAEKKTSEALAKAVALGVIMKSKPSSSWHSCECDSPLGEEGSNHIITASFETAFEVEKEVAAAVKVAFSRLSYVSDSTSKDTLVDDASMSKIKNQDALGLVCNDNSEILEGFNGKTCLHEGCFEADTQSHSEVNEQNDASGSMNTKFEAAKIQSKVTSKELPSTVEVSEDLVNLMLERMKFLSTEELRSLEKIVSTRGLSAMLQELNAEKVNTKNSSCGLADMLVKHVSRLEAEKAAASKSAVLSRAYKKKNSQEDIPDLGSVLVKHTSKLEKELKEAKMSSKGDKRRCHEELQQTVESLDKVLVRSMSRLEREKLEAAMNEKVLGPRKTTSFTRSRADDHSGPGLGDILKKQAPKSKQIFKGYPISRENNDANAIDKNQPSDIKQNNISKRDSKEQIESLDKILVKHISRLEKEKLEAATLAKSHYAQNNSTLKNPERQNGSSLTIHTLKENAQDNTNKCAFKHSEDGGTSAVENHGFIHSGNTFNAKKISQSISSSTDVPDLGSIFTKHVPKFYLEIQAAKKSSTPIQSVRKKESFHNEKTEGLDKILVKRLSRLEQEKLEASAKETSGNGSKTCMTSSNAVEGQHPNERGENQVQRNGVSNTEINDISTRPDADNQASGSEISNSSNTQRNHEKQGNPTETSPTNPFRPAIKKLSKLEIEKVKASPLTVSGKDPWERRRNSRDQELQSAWGGMDLGNTLKPHISKLQREQDAWRKAEEEEKRRPPSD